MNKESRRSPRVALVHPLRVRFGDEVTQAESVTVNAHGALIHSPAPMYLGTRLVVVNQRTGHTARAWVVWGREADRPGLHAAGIEFLQAAPHFWGPAYRP